MKKLVILRGHQGSGKSTYAKKLIADFLEKYPNGLTLEVSYDDILVEQQNGEYNWSPENIAKAQEQAWLDFRDFVKKIQKQDVLVVHSATNQTTKAFKKYVDFAKSRRFEVQFIRLTDFYPNLHNCDDLVVAATYAKIYNNPVEGETIMPQTVAPSEQLATLIKDFIEGYTLEKDPETNSFVTPKYIRTHWDVIKKNSSATYPSLCVYKYAPHVFYNNAFDDALLELRGMVLDQNNRIVVRPFTKTFNLSERLSADSKYPLDIKPDDRFNAVLKVNGFLGCATYVNNPDHNVGERVLYSTTGSLDSWFARKAREHLEGFEELFKSMPGHTFMFEIVDEEDPHIIKEEFGAYLLACRNVATGELVDRTELVSLAKKFSFSGEIKFPEVWENVTWDELRSACATSKREGYVVYDTKYKDIIFKLKTPYYLITKFLGRSKKLPEILESLRDNGLNAKFLNKYSIEEEFFPLMEYLSENLDKVIAMSEQERIVFIRGFMDRHFSDGAVRD